MFKNIYLAAGLVAMLASPALAASISVQDPKVEFHEDEVTVGMTVTIDGGSDKLYAAKTKAAKKVVLSVGDDAAKDAAVDHNEAAVFEVMEGQPLVLEEGGRHLMLMNPKDLKPGDTIKMTLFFEQAGAIKVDIPVGEK